MLLLLIFFFLAQCNFKALYVPWRNNDSWWILRKQTKKKYIIRILYSESLSYPQMSQIAACLAQAFTKLFHSSILRNEKNSFKILNVHVFCIPLCLRAKLEFGLPKERDLIIFYLQLPSRGHSCDKETSMKLGKQQSLASYESFVYLQHHITYTRSYILF